MQTAWSKDYEEMLLKRREKEIAELIEEKHQLLSKVADIDAEIKELASLNRELKRRAV